MERPLNLASASVLAWAAVMITLSATFAHADDAAQAQQAQEELPAFTKAREAAAIAFVKEHKPELLELLKLVHEKNAGEYQKAICQFFAWSEKVADAKGEDRGAVAVALQGWALQIQTQILSAQILRHPDQPKRSVGEIQRQVEALKKEDVAWRKIEWKTCLLDGLQASREQGKPIVLWVFIDRPIDDERC